ncbi:MAG: CotH kinase family protein [Bacteroidales bacterium]
MLIIFLLSLNYPFLNSQIIHHWESVVKADDIWRYFPGNSEPPSNWHETGFDDSSWLSGPGGIGYGDGDDATVISPVTSVYIRRNFILYDTSIISSAVLHVDFDDGFVAYLNGHEIARENIGTVGIRPLHNEFAILTTYEAQLPSGGIPARFIIDEEILSGLMIQGNNVLALQIHNCNSTSSDLSSTTWLSVGIENDTYSYQPVPAWFNDPYNETSHLPLVVIETNGQTIVDEPKITAMMKVIDNGSGQLNDPLGPGTDYDGYIGIEIRGQSSQMFPKKSFALETRDEAGNNLDASLLGMPEEQDWVLYAPYSDKSMLRNSLTFHLGSKMGGWQPRYRFCEVYLNGSYHGVYMLMENIKRDDNRLNISRLDPDETSGDDLTGGYIVKVDKTGGLTADMFFRTYPSNQYYNARNYNFTYVYPKYDEIASQQKTYIQNYLLETENTLNGEPFKDPENGFRKYMDVMSFVDFQIIQELTNNVDGYRYSTFFYKKKNSAGGKLFAGPLWDFDLCYGNVNYSERNLSTETWLYPRYGPNENFPMHWWSRLMEDGGYGSAFVARWRVLREGPFRTDSVMTYIDNTVLHLGAAIGRNFTRWPILGTYVWPNYFVGTTHEQEVTWLKNWVTARLNWMDANIHVTALPDTSAGFWSLKVYPNPVRELMNISLYIYFDTRLDIEVFDLLGRKVIQTTYIPGAPGAQIIQLTVPGNVAAGYYILQIRQGERIMGRQKLIFASVP